MIFVQQLFLKYNNYVFHTHIMIFVQQLQQSIL